MTSLLILYISLGIGGPFPLFFGPTCLVARERSAGDNTRSRAYLLDHIHAKTRLDCTQCLRVDRRGLLKRDLLSQCHTHELVNDRRLL